MIQLNDDAEIRIVSVVIDTLPAGFLEKFVQNVQPEYRDQVMKEHLYALGSINGENEDGYDEWTPMELQALSQIGRLMDDNDASYVRFIKP